MSFTSTDLRLAEFIYYNPDIMKHLSDEGLLKAKDIIFMYQDEFDIGKTKDEFDDWLKTFDCYEL